jgi:dipeptidase E
MMQPPQILLLSNSTQYGYGYLDHAEKEIRQLLGAKATVAFVPYAMFDWDAYESRARDRFGKMGYELESLHRWQGDADRLLRDSSAVFVGGGNTFRLIDRLHRHDLIGKIRARVAEGMRYLGSSAGSIVAGPSIKTTKDMPVVEPPSFSALNLVPFHISPHYLDPDPNSKHMGETQEERILQFLEENDGRVVGLRESGIVSVRHDGVRVLGSLSARLFQRGHAPWECSPGPLTWC